MSRHIPGRFATTAALLIIWVLFFSAYCPGLSAQVAGEVTAVDGTNIKVKLSSKGPVRPGYRVELSYVTSAGTELSVGTWRVKSVKGMTVTAEMIESPTQPVVGLKARIYPKGKAGDKTPSKPSPLTEKTGKPSPPAAGPVKPAKTSPAAGAEAKPWLGVEIGTGQVQGTSAPGTGLMDRITTFLGGKESAGAGVAVIHVYSGSPASRAGIKRKDSIIELNGKPVANHAEFVQSISQLPIGATVNVTVIRDGSSLPLVATLSPVPEYMVISGRAKQYYDGQQFEQAVREYTMAVNLKPDEPSFYFYRGYSRYKLNQLDAALSDFNRSLEINPDSSDAYAFRGLVKAMKREPDAALDDYNRSLSINPAQDWVYRERSVAWEMKGMFNEALDDINKAIEYSRKDGRFLSELYYDRALIKNNLRRANDAMEDIEKAIDADPANARAYGFRGHLYIIKGDYHRALSDLNRSIELDRNLFPSYETRSRAYEALGQVNEALADMKTALSLRPNDPNIREQVRRLTAKASGKR